MAIDLKGRSVLTLRELDARELRGLLDTAIEFKRLKRAGVYPRNLAGKNVALVFLKPSLRTRLSFVVAASDEGAHLEIFPAADIRFGVKESVKDIARVFGRMFDGIGFRGFDHATVRTMAEFSGIPVWNCLCDDYHPTQVLADFMTVLEIFGELEGVRFAYVGDGRNNVASTLIIGAHVVGIDLRIVSPPALAPSREHVSRLTEGLPRSPAARLTVTPKIEDGLRGCGVVYTDVWVSMGEEEQLEERIALLKPYRVSKAMMEATGRSDAIFLHCLPAFHDENTEFARRHPDVMEVTDEVFEGAQSRVFDQAENRMHTAKALMVATI